MAVQQFRDCAEAGDLIYVLDPQLRLIWQSEDWDEFARENNTEPAALADPTQPITRHFSGGARLRWEQMYGVLLSSDAASYSEIFTCHAPHLRRTYQLTIFMLHDDQGELAALVHVTHLLQRREVAPGEAAGPARVVAQETLAGIGWYGWTRSMHRRGADVIWLHQPIDQPQSGVLIDVSGHGPQAASTADALRAQLADWQALPLSTRVIQLNTQLLAWSAGDDLPVYATGLWMDVDVLAREVQVVNFGHPPLLKIAGGYEEIPGGLPVGMFPSRESEPPSRLSFAALGPRVLAYSDGIPEQFNPEGVMFGEERLQACWEAHAASDLPTAVVAIGEAIEAFRGSALIKDDQSLLALELPIS